MKTNTEHIVYPGIIGFGEIGSSISSLYEKMGIKPKIFDTNNLFTQDDLSSCDTIHICFPYGEGFVENVVKYVQKYSPNLVIIHSTVDVGTTRKIEEQIDGILDICHSPIRGLHPNLAKGIQTFPAFIGTDSFETFKRVSQIYHDVLKVPSVFWCNKYETTELAKLLDTTYYGICVAFHKEAKELCEKYKVPFEEVMTRYNQSYNEGYSTLGKPNVVRPVLLDVPGPIGGHCVVPNSKILSKNNPDLICTKAIQKYAK